MYRTNIYGGGECGRGEGNAVYVGKVAVSYQGAYGGEDGGGEEGEGDVEGGVGGGGEAASQVEQSEREDFCGRAVYDARFGVDPKTPPLMLYVKDD